MRRLFCPALLMALMAGCATMPVNHAGKNTSGVIDIGPFSAADCARHQGWIQEVFARPGTVFRFAPGDYTLSDPAGIRIPADATVEMHGARFLLAPEIHADGQAFLLDGVQNVTLLGGEIIGARDAWDAGVNVAGVRVTGAAGGIRIGGLTCRDLSSNAVGVFGASDDAPIRDVTLTDVTGINCCNVYVDYLQPNKGPAPGSTREDQGTAALYYVDGWTADNCRFEGSRSDGTHFFHSHNGVFANTRVVGSCMGGYFLEGCKNVVASGNYIAENGSRGVTIERDSHDCILASTLITHSGREGLWMPDVASILITGNLFIENGRKDDGEKDCEIRLDDTDEYGTQTKNIRIEGSIFRTTEHQTAAILTGRGVSDISTESNIFNGPAPALATASE